MMINRINVYGLFLLAMLVAIKSVAADKQCLAPPPFQLLNEYTAKDYQLDRVLTVIAPLVQTDSHAFISAKAHQRMPRLMSFWATWCAPCRNELPILERLSAQKKAHIVLINIGDTPKQGQQLLEHLQIKQLRSQYADPQLLRDLSLVGLPTTLVWWQSSVYLGVGKIHNDKAFRQWINCLANH